jgi:hypothetical protein
MTDREKIGGTQRIATGCPNYRLSTGELDQDDYLSGDIPSKKFIQSAYDNQFAPPTIAPPTLPAFQCSDLIGSLFLDSPFEDGTQHWVRVTNAIADHIDTVNNHPDKVKFLLESSTGQYEKILTYLEVPYFLNDEDDHNIEQEIFSLTKVKDIIGPQCPLTQQDTLYKGNKYNVQVEWEDGDITYIPLNVLAADDPVSCAIFAMRRDLLHLTGWKQFRRLAREHEEIKQLVFKTKITTKFQQPKFKYGHRVPSNHHEAMLWDKQAGNNLWQTSEEVEIKSLSEYHVFRDLGKDGIPPSDHKKIRCHII